MAYTGSAQRGAVRVSLRLDIPAPQLRCMLPLLQFHSFDFYMHIGLGVRLLKIMHLFGFLARSLGRDLLSIWEAYDGMR